MGRKMTASTDPSPQEVEALLEKVLAKCPQLQIECIDAGVLKEAIVSERLQQENAIMVQNKTKLTNLNKKQT